MEDKIFEFYDEESGESFFVEAPDEIQAIETARHYFEEPVSQGEVSWDEAEALGYDTY